MDLIVHRHPVKMVVVGSLVEFGESLYIKVERILVKEMLIIGRQ